MVLLPPRHFDPIAQHLRRWHQDDRTIGLAEECFHALETTTALYDDFQAKSDQMRLLAWLAFDRQFTPKKLLRHYFQAAYADPDSCLIGLALQIAAQDPQDTDREMEWIRRMQEVIIPLLDLYGMWQEMRTIGNQVLAFTHQHYYTHCISSIDRYQRQHLPLIDHLATRLDIERYWPDIVVKQIVLHSPSPFSLRRREQSLGQTLQTQDILDSVRCDIIIDAPEEACHRILGRLHQLWHHQHAHADEYHRSFDGVFRARYNGYRALVTTIEVPFADDLLTVECSICTLPMKIVNDEGYVGARHANLAVPGAWWDEREPPAVVPTTPTIHVFSPRGERRTLPCGATALDYAFLIHQDAFIHTEKVAINDEDVALSTQLKEHDLIDVHVNRDVQEVHHKWIDWVSNRQARNTIKRVLRNLPPPTNVGREMIIMALQAECDLCQITLTPERIDHHLAVLAQQPIYGELDQVYRKVLLNPIFATKIAWDLLELEFVPRILLPDDQPWLGKVHIARCWLTNPVQPTQTYHGRIRPDVEIVGIIHYGKGRTRSANPALAEHASIDTLKVHRADCFHRTPSAPADITSHHFISLHWKSLEQINRYELAAMDQPQMLLPILQTIYSRYSRDYGDFYLRYFQAAMDDHQEVKVVFDISARHQHVFHSFYDEIAALKLKGIIRDVTVKAHFGTMGYAEPTLQKTWFQNPYKTDFVSDPHLFFGRQSALENALTAIQRQSSTAIDRSNPPILISGRQRIGKTSFLHRLEVALKTHSLPFVPVYYTMAGTIADDMFHLAEEMYAALKQALGPAIALPLPLPLEAYDRYALRTFNQTIQRLAPFFERCRLVLCLDEMTNILKMLESQQEYLRLLRNMMDAWPQITFVFAVHDPYLVRIQSLDLHGLDRLLHGATIITLGPLEEADAQKLATYPIDGQFQYYPTYPNDLFRLTGGEPYFIQILAQSIVARLIPKNRDLITPDLLKEATHEFLSQTHLYFKHIFQRLSRCEMDVLCAVAGAAHHDEQWVDTNTIGMAVKRLYRYPIDAIVDALAHLTLNKTLARCDDPPQYRVVIPLVRHHLRDKWVEKIEIKTRLSRPTHGRARKEGNDAQQ